jgi:thiamine pyrophosphate-dependent acetolactate synthase large subunit-like protein
MTETMEARTAARQQRAEVTPAQALVRVLKNAGIVDYYGVAGGMLTAIMHEVHGDPDLRYTGMRHEAAGGFAAAGQFAGTGKVAVALGEMAPGTANLLSSMGNARNNNLVVLAITTTPPREHAHPFHGMFMEWDARAAYRPYTKYSEQVTDPRRVPEVLRAALREALTGRPGPVHVDLPSDISMGRAVEYDLADLDAPLEQFLPPRRPPGDPDAIARAADLLATARRPLLIAGGGVLRSEATPEFRALAAALGAPATATQMGLGAVDSTAPGFFGHGGVIGGPAVLRAMKEADVALAVGCRWSSWMWESGVPAVRGLPDQHLIHVDIDPTMIGRRVATSVPIHGDARAVLRQLLAALGGRRDVAATLDADWLTGLVAEYRGHRALCDRLAMQQIEPMHPARVAKEVGEWMPAGGLAVYDGGHTTFWSNEYTEAIEPRTRFHDPGMAHLGFGLPWALALKRQRPERTVVNITGDGSFGFTIQELDTLRRYGVNVITVLHDNAAFGIIRAMQQAAGYEMGGHLQGTDYVAIARGFGCHAERVRRPEEIKPALDRAAASGLPAVVDVETFFEYHPSLAAFRSSSSPRT